MKKTSRPKIDKANLLVKSAPGMIFEVDFRESRFVSVNDNVCSVLGYTRKELLTMNPVDVLEGESKKLFLDRGRKYLAGKKLPETVEYTARSKDGRLIYALLNVSFTRENGKPVGVLVVAQDITERKRMESELRETSAYLNNLFNYANAPIICWDPNFKITKFNRAFERLTGYQESEVKGKKLDFLLPAGSRKDSLTKISNTLTGRWETVEIPIQSKNKDIRIALWNSANILADDGRNIIATIAQGGDITERKRAENELHKLNRTLRALSESNQAAIRAKNEPDYLKDVCRIVVETCGHSMVWIGYKENDEAKTIRPMAQAGFDQGYIERLKITWADTERGRGPTGTAIRTGRISICRNMLTDPNFKPWREEAVKRGYASSIVLPLIADKVVFGAITIYSRQPDPFSEEEIKLLEKLAGDLTQGIMMLRLREKSLAAERILKRDKKTLKKIVEERSMALIEAQVKLERSKRLADIGALAATVAHELRNPLATMGMAANNIKTKILNNSADIERHAQVIEKKIFECDQIIRNLLFYARLKPPELEQTNICDLIEDCLDNAQAQSGKKVSLVRKLGAINGLLVAVDTLQFQEVCHNIISNAYDAMADEGGRLEVSALVDNGFLKVNFVDNGEGINKEDLPRVSDPFFSTKTKGTGLGLALCQQIITLHGGKIQIQSEVKNGTKVTVALPIQTPQAQ